MPNPESSPAPQTPAPPTQIQPINNAAPSSEAQSKLAAELERLFPGGAIPDGGRYNSEANMMRSAGRESSVQAAAATPPGSIIGNNIQGPVTGQPVVPVVQPIATPAQPTAQPATPAQPAGQPVTPAQPAAQSTTPAPTPEEKKAAEDKAAAEKAEEAVKAAAAAKKPLTDAERDAAQAAMTPQAGTAFKTLRNENKELKEAIAAKEREISEAKTKLAQTLAIEEAEKLKASLKQAQERLAIFDYKATDEYQTQVAQPLTSVEAEIKALATKNQISEAELNAALESGDMDRLAELSSNFNRLELNHFDRLLSAREDYRNYGKQLEAQAQDKIKNFQQMQQAEQLKAAEAAKAEWVKALDTTQEELAKTMPIFKPTGDAEFDANMSAAIESVKTTDLSQLTNEQIAKVFYRNAAFDLVLGLVTNLHNKNVELDQRVRQLSGTALPAGSGNPPATEVVQPTFKSMQDAVRTLPQILP